MTLQLSIHTSYNYKIMLLWLVVLCSFESKQQDSVNSLPSTSWLIKCKKENYIGMKLLLLWYIRAYSIAMHNLNAMTLQRELYTESKPQIWFFPCDIIIDQTNLIVRKLTHLIISLQRDTVPKQIFFLRKEMFFWMIRFDFFCFCLHILIVSMHCVPDKMCIGYECE